MSQQERIALTRDVDVIMIPDGTASSLSQDHTVTIHQSLGNSFTVITERGHMVQIAGADADALGKEPIEIDTLIAGSDIHAVEKNCWEVMKTVYDPEIPVNIVELGLVYHCKVSPIAEGQYSVNVIMTLTAPGCGMGPMIQSEVEIGLKKLHGVQSVNVEVVFSPPWSREMMSEVAQLQLGMV